MANETQIDHWNSSEADHWVTYQNRYDAMLAPFADRLVTATSLTSDSRVLDVGCGCGSTTISGSPTGPQRHGNRCRHIGADDPEGPATS